jgi:hypothetical protein
MRYRLRTLLILLAQEGPTRETLIFFAGAAVIGLPLFLLRIALIAKGVNKNLAALLSLALFIPLCMGWALLARQIWPQP